MIDSVTRILQLEQQLREWESDLPTGLTLRRSNDIPQEHNTDYHVLERLNVILTLRFHHLKILLHRPILVRFLDCCGEVSSAQHELALLQHIGSNSTLLCVQSAEEIISIVSTIVHSEGRRREYLGAWWFSLYYSKHDFRAIYLHVLKTIVLTITAFNAALVIFASSLIYQHPGPALPLLPPAVGQARKSLDEAATALEALDRGNRLVEKCTAYLKKLSCVLDLLSRPTTAAAALDKSIDPTHQSASKGSDYHTQPNQQYRNALSVPEHNQSDSTLLGMDLGEFMSMDDMAFLDSYTFPLEQPGPGTDFFGA